LFTFVGVSRGHLCDSTAFLLQLLELLSSLRLPQAPRKMSGCSKLGEI